MIKTKIHHPEPITVSHELHEIVKNMVRYRDVRHDDLADRVGLSRSSITNLVNGQQTMTYENFLKIADALAYDVEIRVTARTRKKPKSLIDKTPEQLA